MANSLPRRHFLRALDLWPKDALRPETSFQDAMRRRIQRRLPPAGQEGSTGAATTVAVSERNDQTELEEVNALYSMLEDRYKKKYPISQSFLRPASNPDHYKNLLAELEAVPNRSWLASKLNQWKGFLRFK